jgi:RimJ/RimL family protein N-acetyltransferase
VQDGDGSGRSVYEDPAAMIGLIELCDVENDNCGFWLIPDYQNHVYMTVACHAIDEL